MNYFEIQFKGNRRASFTNPMGFPVKLGDHVIVNAEKGEDLGRVVQISGEDRISQEGERDEVRTIVRKANPHDFQRKRRNLQRENRAEEVCRRFVLEHRLPMKVINVEFQLDGKKVTFFFTAEGRVDFRTLVRDLAGELRTRIELRQIGARDEARKFGGFGPCGQRQCCSGWLSRFDPVTTSMAKEQNLPLNPVKLSGNCGRLKCCLRYELDFYRAELKRYPPLERAVETLRGAAFIEKIDIFNEEVLIRYVSGDLESVTRQELERLMSFDPAENHCEGACGREGLGPDHERPAVPGVLVASAHPPAESPGTAPDGPEADAIADGPEEEDGLVDASSAAPSDETGSNAAGAEGQRRRRGRRGGRRNRRPGEGGSPASQG
ncbi:MAG: regulatory iron-sulfur-containing complex subunit RicT [bacterium]|jgi:cell fate regulator YaaT (PSP1 superfamily)|nr:regulatory iron-sulfur-containing complex subunit RicT [bacterium]